ncbi:tRNA (adenine(58)-N(1))-methyltransferase non-catalytic subunit TRM6 [Acipenser ruthenus]|uniref:tRNA (adenine(58)-N(1))-methyltransferase non-catalytic subunit TRM6 n=1 Tax=Acipenser ruthenus TaxID=7906 RepID=A0A444U2E5_ACIRT|nr:tRNA (adenine(58)-N(1))-methyltransferase non-catalytic subunit TRM6 [Acipenser ruthenus]
MKKIKKIMVNYINGIQHFVCRKIIFEKQWLHLDYAIGQLYGTYFEVAAEGTLQALKANPEENTKETKEAGMDNRNIVDDGRSQKLTRDDIETLKEQGLKEIVQQLIENSSTFRDKTEFAQEKYIKKKKKKYDNTITVLKPSTRIMALMYHGREPGKICNLHYDTLAQMLTLGNIHAGSKIIVFETCAGLVLGAVMERMEGKVFNLPPLMECYPKLHERDGVIGLHLSETWLRHYQVLPNRTHPMLLMSGGGGYILSGMTVEMDPAKSLGPQQTEEPAPKRQKLQDTES